MSTKNDFILLDTNSTLFQIATAVKLKWGYVLMNDIIIETDTFICNNEFHQRLKVSVKKQQP